MQLKGQQPQAAEFLLNWFFQTREQEACLMGYAGTGKTHMMGYFIEKLLEAKPSMRITVMAPTNKALDVLRTKCGHLKVGFCTIDSFLGNRIKRNDDGEMDKTRGKGQENPDLIICDEGSMVKKDYHVDVQRRRVRTLWVGDPAQLPPINEDLATVFTVPMTFQMTEVVRYDGAIIKAATFLRERIESKQTFILSDILAMRDESKQITKVDMSALYDWALTAYHKGLDGRIVAFTNADVNNHNSTMHRMLFPHADLFGVGERVLVNETFELPKTDPDSEETDMLYNGETLYVTSCERNPTLACGVQTYSVGLRRKVIPLEVDGVPAEADFADFTLDVAYDEGHATAVHKDLTNQIWTMRRAGQPESEVKKLLELRKPLNKLAPIRHSYANTVHKSQGSTYDISFVDWSSVYRSQDRARMLYVALTRASKFVVLAAK